MSSSSLEAVESPRILVCQHGSRHRYSIPRMLEDEEVLTALYTDSSGVSWIGKFMRYIGGPLRLTDRLDRWNIQGIPGEKIYSSDLPHISDVFGRLFFSKRSPIERFQKRHQVLSKRMKKWGLQDSNIVYSMYHENLDFIRYAKEQGGTSVVDVFISPCTEKIMEQETALFPDWADSADKGASGLLSKMWDETASLADLLICPSEWVAEGVAACSPHAVDKIRIVPYGCSLNYRNQVNKPVPGRILFAGRDPLRKGLPYLAQAASALKLDGLSDIDIRIAGQMSEEVVKHPLCKDLNFLGQLNQSEMEMEYLAADMLVLPALSEGFAGVVAEAIGAGCPVIVTKEAGSPVHDGREGLIVPSRDTEALTAAIRRMFLDRNLRQHCSTECLKQIPFYSEKMWRKRLIKVFEECNCPMTPTAEEQDKSSV
ncbi:MAG: glycosyltransferase family 4 protein [Pontiella sp.]